MTTFLQGLVNVFFQWTGLCTLHSLISCHYHLWLNCRNIASKCIYRNLSKNRPTLKNKPMHLPFLNEVVAKGTFLLKVLPPIYAIVHAILFSKKHQKSCTVQEDGLVTKCSHHSLLLHKQAQDKRGIAKSPNVYTNRANCV